MLQSALSNMYSGGGGAGISKKRAAARRVNTPQAPPPMYAPQTQAQAPLQTPTDTIFVSIPAYRDPEIITTIEDLFKKAKFPNRVFLGVCQQIDDAKDRAFDLRYTSSNLVKRHLPNIRVLTLPATEAKGPSYARYVIEQELFEDETFFLGIDSHTSFVAGWDVLMIDELLKCPSEKPLLTVYPADYVRAASGAPNNPRSNNNNPQKPRTVNPRVPVPFVKFHTFHPTLGLPQTERFAYKRNPRSPLPSLYLSAGFVFTLGEVIREVPYLPLPYLFLGEEIIMAARYWTHGVDLYSPSKHLVFHLNDRSYRNLFWENFYLTSNGKRTNVTESLRQERKAQEQSSLEQVHAILRGQEPEEVGEERTLDAFWKYTGLNLASKTATREASLGLTPVPSREEMLCKTGQQ